MSTARSEFLRVCPDTVDRRTDRERLTVAVADRAAVRGDLLGSQMARIGLLIQKFLVQNLQMHGARAQRRGNQNEKRQYQCRPADETPRRRSGFLFVRRESLTFNYEDFGGLWPDE